MKTEEIKRNIQYREWAAQIREREESGLSVKEWCAEKGIKTKTYYNHVKRVREETLEALGTRGSTQLARIGGSVVDQTRIQSETPVFTSIPMPQTKGAAITVWIGGHAVDIQNGADDALVEQTLRVVSRL
jgi:hypothetical protein